MCWYSSMLYLQVLVSVLPPLNEVMKQRKKLPISIWNYKDFLEFLYFINEMNIS